MAIWTTRLSAYHMGSGGALLAAALAFSACGPSTTAGAGPGSSGATAPAASAAAPSAGSEAPTNSGSSSAADPCTLITKAEADAAFGVSFDAPTSKADDNTKTCTYAMAGNGTTLSISVRLGSYSKANLDAARNNAGALATDLPGIGDGAFEVARRIGVIKGSTLFSVVAEAGPAIITEEKLRDLARTAAGRV